MIFEESFWISFDDKAEPVSTFDERREGTIHP